MIINIDMNWYFQKVIKKLTKYDAITLTDVFIIQLKITAATAGATLKIFHILVKKEQDSFVMSSFGIYCNAYFHDLHIFLSIPHSWNILLNTLWKDRMAMFFSSHLQLKVC